MIRGSCLCGGVQFEARKVEGAFELCHCSRCRKVAGSDREDFDRAEATLAARFDRNTGSDRSDEFSAFMDASTDPDLGVQLVSIGGVSDTFLAWRDLLRDDIEIRRRYDELKARFEGKSMDEYRDAKSEFIQKRVHASSQS